MSLPEKDESGQAERLSALMDGQASAAETRQLCEAWAKDSQLRDDWHLYQMIGDTLRSDELAQTRSHDQKFLATLSARLAQEPVVLAPQAQPLPIEPAVAAGRRASRARWAAPMTVAAGFMLVAGALVVLQNNGVWQDGGAQPQMAQVTPDAAGPVLASTAAPARELVAVSASSAPAFAPASMSNGLTQTYVVNGQLVRDARLDRYLQAHKEFGAGTALGVSTGYLRNASYDTPQP